MNISNNNEKQVYSLLGLCQKAGYVKAGEFQTEKAVKSGLAYLLIVADDSSDNTKKKFKNMAAFYETPYLEFGEKDALGRCIGCEFRASLAVTNEGLANKILSKIQNNNQNT